MPTTASAVPTRLFAFATASRDRSLTHRCAAGRLRAALAPLRLSIQPGIGIPPPLDSHLYGLVGRWEEIEDHVERVARAFLTADEVSLLPPVVGDAVRWVVDQADDLGLIRQLRKPVWTLVTGATPPLLARFPKPVRTVGGRLVPAISLGLTATSVVEDIGAVVDQGNPARAFQARGTDYMADIAEVQLDLALGLFTARPHPITAAAALGAGVSWGNWKTYDERRRAAGRVVETLDRTQDRVRDDARDVALGVLSAARGALGGSGRGNPTLVPPLFDPVLDAAERAVEGSDEVVDEVVDQVRDTTEEVTETFGEVVNESLEAAGDVVDEGVEAAEEVLDTLGRVTINLGTDAKDEWHQLWAAARN